MTSRIPVEIVLTEDVHGTKKITLMMDLSHYMAESAAAQERIRAFKEGYSEMLKTARKIYAGGNRNRRTSSTYWRLGSAMLGFASSVSGDFEVANYTAAVSRDFGISPRHARCVMSFAAVFSREEVSDRMSFAYYKVFLDKMPKLEGLGIFQREKRRLGRMEQEGRLRGRDTYSAELDAMIAEGSGGR